MEDVANLIEGVVAIGVGPGVFGEGIEPAGVGEAVGEAVEPVETGFLVGAALVADGPAVHACWSCVPRRSLEISRVSCVG